MDHVLWNIFYERGHKSIRLVFLYFQRPNQGYRDRKWYDQRINILPSPVWYLNILTSSFQSFWWWIPDSENFLSHHNLTLKSHFSFLISLTEKHASGKSSWSPIGEFLAENGFFIRKIDKFSSKKGYFIRENDVHVRKMNALDQKWSYSVKKWTFLFEKWISSIGNGSFDGC